MTNILFQNQDFRYYLYQLSKLGISINMLINQSLKLKNNLDICINFLLT